jgi:hypothetical protein
VDTVKFLKLNSEAGLVAKDLGFIKATGITDKKKINNYLNRKEKARIIYQLHFSRLNWVKGGLPKVTTLEGKYH